MNGIGNCVACGGVNSSSASFSRVSWGYWFTALFFVLFENLNVSSQTWLTALQEFMSDYGKKHDIQYFPITTCRLLGNNSFVLFKSQQRMSY